MINPSLPASQKSVLKKSLSMAKSGTYSTPSSLIPSLGGIDVFGFDYDYTLASYTDKVQHFIYDHTLGYMVEKLGYDI